MDAVQLGNLELVRMLVGAGASGNVVTATPQQFELYHKHMHRLGWLHRWDRAVSPEGWGFQHSLPNQVEAVVVAACARGPAFV